MSIEEWLDENPEYKAKYEAMTDEEKQQLVESAERIECAVNATRLLVKRAVEAIKNFLDDYPNKRVMRLALYGKNKRVRKKNMNRIKKDLKRYIKNEHRRAH